MQDRKGKKQQQEASMRVDAGTTDVVDEVKSLASHWSSPAKRAVLNRKLVTLRTKHISKALFFPGQVFGDIDHHIKAVKGLLEAGNDLASTPSSFAAAFGTLALAQDALQRMVNPQGYFQCPACL